MIGPAAIGSNLPGGGEIPSRGLMEVPPYFYELLPHLIVGLFVFAFGACLGSFINVVIYRLPAGISVISPPSRCPVCGVRLGWRENLPIVGWLLLRGRCRACGVGISSRYIVIETVAGLLLLALYLARYAPPPTTLWWGELGGAWWHRLGPLMTLPAFLVQAGLLIGLLAMARIDARTFTIPIQIPNVVVGTALLLWPLQAILPAGRPGAETWWPIPIVEGPMALAALGGGAGIAIATLLLWSGRIRPSFADYDEYVAAAVPQERSLAAERSDVHDSARESLPHSAAPAEGPRVELLMLAAPLAGAAVGAAVTGWSTTAIVIAGLAAILALYAAWDAAAPASAVDDAPLAEYPHARREVLREVGFLLPALILAATGWWVGARFGVGPESADGVGPVVALASSIAGYLVAGGIVWAIRIFATLGFGREAMGLGDVHLFGAAGAALGWIEPLWAFVVAPFLGLAWVGASLLGRLRGSTDLRQGGAVQQGSLPFGPHLAVAIVLVMALRPALDDVVRVWLGEAPG